MPVTPREENAEPERRPGAGSSKKRYEAPRLTDYGPVSKLTQSGGITVPDFMSMKGICL